MFDRICLSGIENQIQVYSTKECCNDNSTQRHVFLVTQTQDGADVPVMCLVVLETPLHACIQYVDTTGLLLPRAKQSQLTKEIIRAYVGQGRFESVQLFAFASDELVFRGSSSIPQKQPLSAVKLINWWIKCLEPFKAHAYIYSPFEERSGSRRLCHRVAGTLWTYGHPWPHDAHFSSIPVFATQDDPLWQHYECMSRSGPDASKMTVRAFWETIQLRDEFRQEPSAFIALHFGTKPHSDDFVVEAGAGHDHTVLERMQSMDWGSRGAATDACSQILGLFTSRVVIRTKPEEEKENTATARDDTLSNVNNVQSLVRKRQKTK